MPLGGRTRNDPGKELEVDSKLWRQSPLHSTVAPSFETCNLSRHYALDIKVGLSYGTPDSINVRIAKTRYMIIVIDQKIA